MMSQNTSSAVMQQRSEPHDSLDDFPTQPWATRALCEWIAKSSPKRLGDMSVREPAANRGHMVRPLFEYFGHVMASDVHDYGAGYRVEDYLFGPDDHFDRTDWTITNPPFRLAVEFIERARRLSRVGTAMLVRTAFLEGIDRYEKLFSVDPPTVVLQFVERVVMHRGVLRRTGEKYIDPETGKEKTATTATAYQWLVWINGAPRLPFDWIPPCRKQLERAEDYAA